MQNYGSKHEDYFSAARRDIEALLPVHAARVLEIGCGSGVTLAWLKSSGRAGFAAGVELHEPAFRAARAVADACFRMNVETDPMPAGLGRFDLVLCLDVLEHLLDPWAVVDRLVREQLDAGGTLIVSVPNVRHYSVLLPLAFRGRWEYSDRGLLDRTHLRYFTHRSALQLLDHPLLGPARCLRPGLDAPAPWSAKRLFDRLTLGLFRELLAYHYLLAAQKRSDAELQQMTPPPRQTSPS
jgi:SAM-dependent methyltransferase